MSISGYLDNLIATANHDLSPFIRIGQIYKVYYIDDGPNISKTHPEYDVWVFDNKGSQILKQNVRSMNLVGGQNDYEENILEPSEFAAEGELADFNQPLQRNGTFVLVAFLNGDENTPLIIGALDHPGLANPSATKDKGVHSSRTFRGLTQYINKDGEYEITFTGAKGPDGTPNSETQLPIIFKLGKVDLPLPAGDSEEGSESEESEESPVGHKIFVTANDGKDDRIVIATNGGQMLTIEDSEEAESISIIQKSGSKITMETDGSIRAVGKDESYILLNAETNEVSLFQKDGNSFIMSPESIKVSHTNGTDIVTIEDGSISTESGGDISTTAKTISLTDTTGAGLSIKDGKVALGGSAAELLDLFEQTLTQMDALLTGLSSETHVGNLGFPTAPPVNAAQYASVQAQVATIKGLLSGIKGSL